MTVATALQSLRERCPSPSMVLLALGMFFFGTVNTISKKAQNFSWSIGLNGDIHPFHKPWFQTLIMFLGEAVCLIYFGLVTYRQRKKEAMLLRNVNSSAADEPLQIQDDLQAGARKMLRGSVIIFTGVLSVLFLKRKLNLSHWAGMLVMTGGIVLVGYASLLGGSATGGPWWRPLVGDVLVVAGMLCNAVQFVIEEVLLKRRNIPPAKVVGMEGVFGALMMTAVVLPVLYFIPGSDMGSYENFIDAWVMLGHNGYLMLYVLLYLGSIAFYNLLGLTVTKTLTTVHRTLLDALRTLCVWGVQLALFAITHGQFGESWDSHSYIQLIGFAVMVVGTCMYNQIIRVPVPQRCRRLSGYEEIA